MPTTGHPRKKSENLLAKYMAWFPEALRSMSPASQAYKGLTGKVEGLVGRLLG